MSCVPENGTQQMKCYHNTSSTGEQHAMLILRGSSQRSSAVKSDHSIWSNESADTDANNIDADGTTTCTGTNTKCNGIERRAGGLLLMPILRKVIAIAFLGLMLVIAISSGASGWWGPSEGQQFTDNHSGLAVSKKWVSKKAFKFTGKNGKYGNFTGQNGNFTGQNGNFTGQNGNFTGQNGNFTGQNGNFTGQNGNFTGQNGNVTGQNGLITHNGRTDVPIATNGKPKVDFDHDEGKIAYDADGWTGYDADAWTGKKGIDVHGRKTNVTYDADSHSGRKMSAAIDVRGNAIDLHDGLKAIDVHGKAIDHNTTRSNQPR